MIDWKAFNKYWNIMKSALPISLKCKAYNEYRIVAMIYGDKRWKIKSIEKKLKNTYRSMEREILWDNSNK